MTAKADQKQQTREAILASAAALLRERGIKASSVMDVMKGAGLTVGGFYNHFESKEHLFSETIRSAARLMWDRLLASGKADSPHEKAKHLLRGYLSRTHRDQPENGCLLPSVAGEIAREGDPYRQALESELEHFVGSLASLLGDETTKEPHGLPAKGAAREQALAIIALMFGALSLSRAMKGTTLSDEILRTGRKIGLEMIERAGDSSASR